MAENKTPVPDEQELWRIAKLIRQSTRELDRQLNSKKTR